MANKKKPQTSIEPDLQAYLDQIAANHQPDQKALQHRIDNAIIRYDATQRVQKFSDKPALLIDKLQQLTIDGWRYYLDSPHAVLSNPAILSVTLQKPPAMIADELEALCSQVTSEYNNELVAAMEREIDVLMCEAAQDAQRKADEQATAEQAAMRNKLRNMLIGVTA